MAARNPPAPLREAARAVHELGLAALLGGTLFGRLALHPSVTAISDPRERGSVVNAAWSRYGVVNGVGLAAIVAGWAGTRATSARDGRLTPRERALVRAEDALVGATALLGTASAVDGVRFARQAPQGAVPLADGDHTAPGAPPRAARIKRRLNVLGVLTLAAEAGLVAVDAVLSAEGMRRRPVWRRVALPGRS
jgi:hypothetical protein